MKWRNLWLILGGGLLLAALVVGTTGVMLAQPPAPGWTCPMLSGYGSGSGPLGSLSEAEEAFQAYLERLGEEDLVLDEVMQFEANFYAIVRERSTGIGAMELLADPRSGAVFPEYGPNMMWNTQYGHMAGWGGGQGMMGWGSRGGMMGGAWGSGGPAGMMGWGFRSSPATSGGPGEMAVSPQEARQIAQRWLDANLPGTRADETPDTFYGYYTLHFLRAGRIEGMLSVNGYSGQVWYHSWHGAFEAMEGGDH